MGWRAKKQDCTDGGGGGDGRITGYSFVISWIGHALGILSSERGSPCWFIEILLARGEVTASGPRIWSAALIVLPSWCTLKVSGRQLPNVRFQRDEPCSPFYRRMLGRADLFSILTRYLNRYRNRDRNRTYPKRRRYHGVMHNISDFDRDLDFDENRFALFDLGNGLDVKQVGMTIIKGFD